MTLFACFKKQLFLLSMCAIAGILSYLISLHVGFREPYQWTMIDTVVSLLALIIGTLFRFFFQKKLIF